MGFLDTLDDIDNLWRHIKSGSTMHALQRRVSFWMMKILLIIVTPMLVLSLSRTFTLGWQPMFTIHIGLYVVFWLVYLNREKLGLTVTAWVQVVSFLIIGWAGYANMGLLSFSQTWLAAAGLMAALLLGARAGIATMVVAAGVSVGIGAFSIQGQRLPMVVDDQYLLGWSTWLLSVSVWVAPAALMIAMFMRFGRGALGLLQDAATQNEELQASEHRFRSMLNSTHSIGVVTADARGNIEIFNHGAEQIFGYKAEDIAGQSLTRLMPERFQHAHAKGLAQACQTGQLQSPKRVHRVNGARADGTEFPMEFSLSTWQEDNAPHFAAIILDMTNSQMAQQDIALLHLAIEQSPIGIAILNPDGSMSYSNEPYQRMRQLNGSELATHNALEAIEAQAGAALLEDLADLAKSKGRWTKDLMVRTANGQHLWERVNISPVRNAEGRTVNYLIAIEDMTEIKGHQEELNRLTNQCPLTGLPNRGLLTTLIDKGLGDHKSYAVMVVDLIDLKHINESLGFEAGDAMIKAASARLNDVRPETVTLAHLGAGQYALAGGNWSTDEINVVAHKIVSLFTAPFEIDGKRLFQTVSIGIAVAPADGDKADALLSNAHAAKGRSRKQGENRWNYYSNELNTEAQKKLHMDTLLRQAMDSHEFQLHFQPKVNARGDILGAEALLRWHSKELGVVSPAQFIPFAEHNDLILLIGKWVLEQGCLETAKLLAQGHQHLRIAINVSARQFLQEDFIDVVKTALVEANIPAHAIELEITENVFLADHANILNAHVSALRAMGIRLALDDFGTGYASLGYLRRIAFDTIKIDQTFIRDLFTRTENANLVKSMIDMGHALGAQIVAEGVEDESQVKFLTENGCDLMQGFYFARPMTTEGLMERLQHRSGE